MKRALATGTMVVGLAATVVVGGSAQAAPAGPAALTPGYGAVTIEAQDPNRQYRAMPTLQYVHWTDAGGTHARFLRAFQVSPDDGGQTPVRSRLEYQDAAKAWQPAKDARTGGLLMNSADAQYIKVGNEFTGANGDIVIVDEQARKDTTGRYLTEWSSADGGVSWSPTKAYIDMTGAAVIPEASGHAFQGVLTLPDGTLVTPFYAAHKATYNSDGSVRQTWSAAHLLTGGTTGASWTRAATVFLSDTNTYSESAVTQLADKRLLMIARYDVTTAGVTESKLLARTTNGPVNTAADLAAATWGTAYAVQVPGAADAAVVRGVSPILHTMDQGVVMLVFGRPRNKITFSYDGGRTWSTAHSFYDNLPGGCTASYHGHPCADLGSSGYMGVAVTGPRSVYIMGDNCQAGWGCPSGYTYPHTTDDRLWLTTVTLN